MTDKLNRLVETIRMRRVAGAVRRYASPLAAQVAYGSDATEGAGHMAYQFAHGENNALAVLADYMEDHDHPIVPYLRRIMAGEGEGRHLDHSSLGTQATVHKKLYPYDYAILRSDGNGEPMPESANVALRYYHLPDRHLFHVHFRTNDVPEGGDDFDRVERSFLLPVTPQEVQNYANELRSMGSYHVNNAAEFEQALNNPDPEVQEFYDYRLAHAGQPPRAHQPPQQMKRVGDAVRRYAMHDDADFHRRMHEDPQDETAHLVYADWLDDQGRHGLAKMIRAGIEDREGRRNPEMSRAGHTDAEWTRRASAGYSTKKNPSPGAIKDDLIGTFLPSVADPDRAFYYSAWFPRAESSELLRQLAKEGFQLPSRPEQSGYRDTQIVLGDDFGPDDPNYNRHLARAVNRYAATYRAPEGGMIAPPVADPLFAGLPGQFYKGGKFVSGKSILPQPVKHAQGDDLTKKPRRKIDLDAVRKRIKAKKVKYNPNESANLGTQEATETPLTVSYSRAVKRFAMHSPEDFHANIAENPSDTTGALVYADFLNDLGTMPAHEKLIRDYVDRHGQGARHFVSLAHWKSVANPNWKTAIELVGWKGSYGKNPLEQTYQLYLSKRTGHDSAVRWNTNEMTGKDAADLARQLTEESGDGVVHDNQTQLLLEATKPKEPTVEPPQQLSRAVKRFAADSSDINAMLNGLNGDDRRGAFSPDADYLKRDVLADAMEENGRDREGALLRSKHPIIVHDGKVYGGYGNHLSEGYSSYEASHAVYGDPMCHSCANEIVENEPELQPGTFHIHPHLEGPPIPCTRCGQDIPSSYGDPDEPDEPPEDEPTIDNPYHRNWTELPNLDEPPQPPEGPQQMARVAVAVKRYAMGGGASQSDVDAIMRTMHPRDWRGSPGADMNKRSVLADAINDTTGDETVPALLRSNRHLYLHDGQIRDALKLHPTVGVELGDPFVRQYVETALWSTPIHDWAEDAEDRPMDEYFDRRDIHPDTLAAMIADAHTFRSMNGHLLENERHEPNTAYNFWLSRNGHGTGFFDRHEEYEHANDLQEAARSHGEYDLYVGDDGMIHGSYEVSPNEPEHGEQAQQMARSVKKYAMESTLAGLFRAAREDPYNETRHGVIADALEDQMPDSPIHHLIREQFGITGGEPKNNLWYEPVENSWDGTFPYAARLGRHGPFDLYLRHEGQPNQNQRWVLHAVSNLRGSRDFGYTFEFPHEEAHRIPQMFPSAEQWIHPDNRNLYIPREATRRIGIPWREWRAEEANRFDNAMDEEERNRP